MNKTRILIVEDKAMVARDLARQLEESGYEPVAQTALGEESVRLAEQLRPDLVLMDIQLGGPMDGIGAAQIIRERFSIPVVFLTAHRNNATLPEATLNEPFGYIIKPCEDRELRTVLEIALYKHQAEERLRDSREELATILRTTMDGFLLLDAQGRFIEVNDVYCQLVGYTREELLTLGVSDLDPGESPEGIAAHIARVQRLGGDRFERRHRRKDGTLIPVEISVNYLPRSGGRLFCFLRDITERKRSGAALEGHRMELQAIYDHAPVMLCLLDRERRVRYANHAFAEFAGVAAEAMKSERAGGVFGCVNAQQDPRGCGFGSDCQRCGLRLAVTDTHETGRSHHHVEYRATLVRNQDRREVVLLGATTRIQTGDEQTTLLCLADITDYKNLQTRFLRAQRLESIGTLASGIAHDLNNVLSPILMGLTVVRSEVKSADNLAMIDMVQNSARRGAETVKQLLTFARGAGAQKGLVQPRHLLKEVGQLLKRTFPKNIQIYTDYPDVPWAILADPSQIHQVLMNLSVNARDAMPGGGVLFLKLRNQVLGEAGLAPHHRAHPGPYVVFEVNDSGQGMPPEVVERIFEPFFTTKPEGEGTGLGLSTVIGIVEEHGGFVLVDTQVGRGTTFSAYLPAEPNAHETPGETSRPESAAPHAEGILVVDDEPSIVNVALQFLTQLGYKVATAKNASEALEWFKAHRPEIQLVITDIMMPFVDGRQLIRSLRELDPHLPILVMSGMLTPSLQGEIQAQGACAFLVKPFAAEDLLAKLEEMLPGGPA